MSDIQAEADKRYPPDHEVDDPHGATGVARSDEYGYDEMANRAFVAGGVWVEGHHRAAAERLVELSLWIDAGNMHRDPEARTWGRLSKLAEETGEVIRNYIGVTGQNPRKGVDRSMDDVLEELLDVAITALGAYEHALGHPGSALTHLEKKIVKVADRALAGPSTEGSIEDLIGLSARAMNALRRELDEPTIAELVQWSASDILNIRNLGVNSLDEIVDALQFRGLKLAEKSTGKGRWRAW